MSEVSTSPGFYQRKADEQRRLAESEAHPAMRAQHLRIAAMYQALADQTTSRPAAKIADSNPRISIPKGVLRSV